MGLILTVGGIVGSIIGVGIFKVLQKLGQIDLAISLVYVIFLGTIGSLMLVDSIKVLLEKKYDIRDLWKQLPAWLNAIGPDENRQPPLFINSIGGLGSPWWNNSIEPAFIIDDDLADSAETQPPSLDPASQAVAVIESIVFMICINLEIMQSGQTLSRLRVCGGLSQLDGLCQRLADLSALPVERLNLPEATARGIAWLAAGKPDDWSRADVEIFKPGNNAKLYKRYAKFSAIMNNML